MADETELNINIGSNPAGVEKGTTKAKTSIKGVTDEAKQLDAAFVRLRSAIDPTFRATEKYNKTLADNKKLLDAGRISQDMYAQGCAAAKAILDQETAAIARNSQAVKAASAESKRVKQEEAAQARRVSQEKIAAARAERAEKERLEQAERQAIRLAASLARQAAQEAARSARAPSSRAVGRVDPALAEGSRSIKQLEYDIQRAMSAAERLSNRATAAAGRAAQATSAKTAQAAQASAQAAAAAAEEAHNRVINLSRQKAAMVQADAQREAAAVKTAEQQKKQAARDASAAAAQAVRDKAKAERDAIKASRDAAKAAADQAKAERQLAQATQQMRASIDPVFAAQERYNEQMRIATQLLMAGKLRTGEWTTIQRQAKAQMDVNTRSMGRMNAVSVQMGYQMQDVVASWSSGINPLVILAQQGGQTAAALSQMGGTVGKVASFMAGPWGAAIIGFTLLLGYLWQSEEEGKQKTIDLKNAEDRRTATVRELTAALRDYVAQQREANNTNLENLRITNAINYTEQLKLQKEVTDATKALTEAQEAYNQVVNDPASLGIDPESQGVAISAAATRITQAEKRLADAQKAVKTATEAVTESRVALAQATSEATAADIEHQKKLQEITDDYRKLANSHVADAATYDSSGQKAKDYQAMLASLRAENERYNAVKEREAAARRENAKEARDEAKAIFQSREAAIGVAGKELRGAGFSVTGNKQFNPTTGHANDREHNLYNIDVGIPGFGPNNPEASDAAATRRMDQIAKTYQARGFRVIWNGKTYQPGANAPVVDFVPKPGAQGDAWHRSHMDIQAPKSIVGQPAGAKLGGQLVNDAEAVANELKRINEEQMQDDLAAFDFRKELAGEDLQQVLAIQDEKLAAIRAFYGAESREAMNAGRDKIRIERQIQQLNMRIAREAIEQKLQLAQQAAQRELDARQAALALQSDVGDFKASNNLVGEQAAIAEKARILNEQYELQRQFEENIYNMKVAALRKQLNIANLPLEVQRQINQSLEDAESEHLSRMAGMQQQHARDVQRINLESAQVTVSKWREVASTMTQAFGSAFQGLWTRSITWQQALINIGDQLVYKSVDMGLRALEQFIVQQGVKMGIIRANNVAEVAAETSKEAAKTGIVAGGEASRTAIGTTGVVVHAGQQVAKVGATVAGEAAQTGAKAAGEATRGGIGAFGALKEIAQHAAVAAAGVYRALASIPYIGPIIAPAAAAAALVAVFKFGQMVVSEKGLGEVENDGQMAMLHKKETVLPAYIAEPMRQAFKTRGSSTPMFAAAGAAGAMSRNAFGNNRTESTFNYQPTNNLQSMSFEDLLRRDGRTLRRWFNNQVRNGTLTLDSR